MSYSDAEKAEAMIRLALNKYDYAKTAADTGLQIRTLRNWEKKFPKKGIPDLLERAIQRLLMAIPKDMSGHEWGVALGILLDKWLLINGQATSRSENIFGFLNSMSDDELNGLLTEFKEAAGRGINGPNGEGQALESLSAGPGPMDQV